MQNWPVFVVGLIFTWSASAQDWPQWRGPERNGQVPPAEIHLNKLPSEPRIVWKKRIGPGLSSPVTLHDKVVYLEAVAGKETVHAANRETGEIIWSHTLDDTFHDTQGPDGPRATPVIDEDRVYAVSCRGQLDCLSFKDGKKLWGINYTNDFGAIFIGEKGNVPGASRHGNNGAPLVLSEFVFAAAGGTNGAGVVCLDKLTGKTVWKSQNDMAAYAPVEIAHLAGVPQILAFTVEGLISLSPKTGVLFWRVPIQTAFGRHVTAPVWERDLVIVSSHQAGMIATKVESPDGLPAASEAWISKENAMNFSSPVLLNGHLYGLGPRKNLICVEVATGKQKWAQEGYIQTSADKAHAAFLGMGSNILCLTDSGQLVLFRADPEKFQELGTLQVAGLNWCNPAYADGKLYLRDGVKGAGDLICVDLRSN